MVVNWKEQGACFGTYPAVDMMGPQVRYQALPLIEQYCDHCPVILPCLDYAESQGGEATGVWGGVLLPTDTTNLMRTRKKRKETIDNQRVRIEQRVYS